MSSLGDIGSVINIVAKTVKGKINVREFLKQYDKYNKTPFDTICQELEMNYEQIMRSFPNFVSVSFSEDTKEVLIETIWPVNSQQQDLQWEDEEENVNQYLVEQAVSVKRKRAGRKRVNAGKGRKELNEIESKRRKKISENLNRLKPFVNEAPDSKITKAELLGKTADRIAELEKENQDLKAKLQQASSIPLTCKSTLWPVLRIPGSSLIGRGYLTVNKLLTRRECIERCLFETSFKCRSVSFQISQRNNMVRMGFTNILNKDVMGRCILSRDDKNSEPDSFRVAQINDEYIENQCHVVTNGVEEQFLDDLCAYEHYSDSALIYAEREYIGITDRECQEKCFKEQFFFCKGITYQKMDRAENSRCYIHSGDVVSMGPRAVIPMRNSYYMKRVQCLNLNVRCTQNEMIIRYLPRQFFQGRIYTENHADECAVSGSAFGPTFLTLPIGTSLKEHRCGIHRAFDYETPNRTLIFTYIIIQNNPLVMMQSDRYIKVGCISRFNRTSSDGMPDVVSLETSMEFGSKDYDGVGSLVIDNGGDIPKLRVFILDPVEDTPVKEAKIGQVLKFVILMESHTENYDLRAINLTATSELDRLELIGPTGCPKNPAIFPSLQHEQTSTTRQLVTKFKAFKFASSSQLKFSVSIQFCYHECMPINCGYGIVSHGRRKRDTGAANIVNKRLNPIVFPDDASPAAAMGKIIFPDETSTTTIAPPGPIKFPELQNEKMTVTQLNTPGVRIDSFGNPQGVQSYLAGIKEEENEVPDGVLSTYKSRMNERVVTVPLDVTLIVIENEVNGTDRLVIGDNDQIYVAGLASSTSSLCLDQSLLTAILIFWIIFQILILLGCCIMVHRYRKFKSLDDDRSSFDNQGYYPDSLENRHVRWADQRSRTHHDVYFQ